MVTGALVEFIFNVEPTLDDDPTVSARKDDLKQKVPEKARRAFQTAQERFEGQSMLATWGATGVILAAALWGWYFFLPLTYGRPGLSVDEVRFRFV